VNIVIDDHSADKFMVQIIDNGKGISEKNLEKIFMMYDRVN